MPAPFLTSTSQPLYNQYLEEFSRQRTNGVS